MKKQKRAIRRHHRARIKNNLLRDSYVCRSWIEPVEHSGDLEDHERWIHDHFVDTKWIDRALGLMINTRKSCGGLCCSNPRKAGFVDKTIQEQKQLDKFKSELEDWLELASPLSVYWEE